MSKKSRKKQISYVIGKLKPEYQVFRERDRELLDRNSHLRRIVRAPYEGEFPPDKGFQSVILTRGEDGLFVAMPMQYSRAYIQSLLDRGVELSLPYTDAMLQAGRNHRLSQ